MKAIRSFGIIKMDVIYRIPKSIINEELFTGVRNINKFIKDSLIFQEAKKAKKKEQDAKHHLKRSSKKIGKVRLSSKD